MKKTISFRKGQVVGDEQLLNVTSLFPVKPVEKWTEVYEAYADFKVTIEYKEE